MSPLGGKMTIFLGFVLITIAYIVLDKIWPWDLINIMLFIPPIGFIIIGFLVQN